MRNDVYKLRRERIMKMLNPEKYTSEKVKQEAMESLEDYLSILKQMYRISRFYMPLREKIKEFLGLGKVKELDDNGRIC